VSRYAVRHLVAGEVGHHVPFLFTSQAVNFSSQIDALLIAKDADIVDKGKRGKHDFFGKTSAYVIRFISGIFHCG
jgi:chromosome transmission fidelity protein 18